MQGFWEFLESLKCCGRPIFKGRFPKGNPIIWRNFAPCHRPGLHSLIYVHLCLISSTCSSISEHLFFNPVISTRDPSTHRAHPVQITDCAEVDHVFIHWYWPPPPCKLPPPFVIRPPHPLPASIQSDLHETPAHIELTQFTSHTVQMWIMYLYTGTI